MDGIKGLEKVDPEKLRAQYALTEALWAKLVEHGVRDRATAGRIDCFFLADDADHAGELIQLFDWAHEVTTPEGATDQRQVRIVTSEATLSLEALRDLVEVMMVAAVESGCTFDGFGVDEASLRSLRKRPWWRLW